MFLEKINLGNETTAKQFVEEANKNVTSVLDERFGLQYDVAFKQKGSDVLVEYETYQVVLYEYIQNICKKLNFNWNGKIDFVEFNEFHKLPVAYK